MSPHAAPLGVGDLLICRIEISTPEIQIDDVTLFLDKV